MLLHKLDGFAVVLCPLALEPFDALIVLGVALLEPFLLLQLLFLHTFVGQVSLFLFILLHVREPRVALRLILLDDFSGHLPTAELLTEAVQLHTSGKVEALGV